MDRRLDFLKAGDGVGLDQQDVFGQALSPHLSARLDGASGRLAARATA